MKDEHNDEHFIQAVEAHFKNLSQKKDEEVKGLKYELDYEKFQNQKVRNKNTDEQAIKTELESFFFSCVEELRKDFQKRQYKAKPMTASSTNPPPLDSNIRKPVSENQNKRTTILTKTPNALNQDLNINVTANKTPFSPATDYSSMQNPLPPQSAPKYLHQSNRQIPVPAFPLNSILNLIHDKDKLNLIEILITNDQLLMEFYDQIFSPPPSIPDLSINPPNSLNALIQKAYYKKKQQQNIPGNYLVFLNFIGENDSNVKEEVVLTEPHPPTQPSYQKQNQFRKFKQQNQNP